MAEISNRILNEKIKATFLPLVSESLSQLDYDVLRVGSNEIAIPTLDEEKNEKWVVITVKVPTGSRDGEEYDGYSLAEEYEMKQKEKIEKAKATAEKKAKKIAEDKRKREERARLKAEKEKEKGD